MGGVKKSRGGRTAGKKSARRPAAKPKRRSGGAATGGKRTAVKPKAARPKATKRKASTPKAAKPKGVKPKGVKPKAVKPKAKAMKPKAAKLARTPVAPPGKPNRARPGPVREIVRIRDLDPFRKCGPGTSVERLIRVDEMVNRQLEAHLVFLDRHGWYCEHGRSCPAVGHARRHAQHVERPEW